MYIDRDVLEVGAEKVDVTAVRRLREAFAESLRNATRGTGQIAALGTGMVGGSSANRARESTRAPR